MSIFVFLEDFSVIQRSIINRYSSSVALMQVQTILLIISSSVRFIDFYLR